MRIEGNPGLQIADDLASGKRTESKSSPITLGENDDQATISQQHKRTQSLVTRVISAPETRQEKITALSSAVRSGTYQFSPEKTADAMLDQWRRRRTV